MSYFVFGELDIAGAGRATGATTLQECGRRLGIAVECPVVRQAIIRKMLGDVVAPERLNFMLSATAEQDTSAELIGPRAEEGGLAYTAAAIERIGSWVGLVQMNEWVRNMSLWFTDGFDPY